MKVYIPQDIDQAGKDYLLERGYEIFIGSGTTEEIMMKEITDADALIVRVAKVTEKLMLAAPKLKVIGRHGAGTDNIDLEAARHLGIRVTNGPDSNTESVAEHTVMLMLAVGRQLNQLNDAVHKGDFGIRNRVRLFQMEGKTVGLLGSGRIAQSVARKLHFGFGMKVLTYGTKHPERLPEYMELVSDIEELFSRSDIISLHCPLTQETRGLVDGKVLACAKDGAIFINAARGEIVDKTALYAALKEGKLRGVGMDVYEGGEIRADDPLLMLSNVICTPHCASHTPESFRNMAVHAAMGVHEVLSGLTVTWPVV